MIIGNLCVQLHWSLFTSAIYRVPSCLCADIVHITSSFPSLQYDGPWQLADENRFITLCVMKKIIQRICKFVKQQNKDDTYIKRIFCISKMWIVVNFVGTLVDMHQNFTSISSVLDKEFLLFAIRKDEYYHCMYLSIIML